MAWVAESTTAHSRTDRGNMGYGYLWWTLDPDVFGPGAASAIGYGGRHIAIVPSKRLVVVQTVEHPREAAGFRPGRFGELLRQLLAETP